MATVDPGYSLAAVLRDYHPHPGWRNWFAEAYAGAIEGADPAARLAGWKTAAVIFGDMHVPVFCLFVCLHGQGLVPSGDRGFLGHYDLCLWELGLATPARPDGDVVPSGDIGHPDGFRRDVAATERWLAEQLQLFGGNPERAALFAMRLTAIRFDLLRVRADPSVAQVLDESLWERQR
ncbi:hypothetical protein J0H58_12945 [bacterium]|nr:hypothetical protein [bacterium]